MAAQRHVRLRFRLRWWLRPAIHLALLLVNAGILLPRRLPRWLAARGIVFEVRA